MIWEETESLIQRYPGALSFGADAWTSPNHKAYVAVTVHFEENGEPMCFLLDLVEVPKSHTGVNLAAAFAKILADFGIAHKVSWLDHFHKILGLTVTSWTRFSALHAITHRRTM
jgi:hypothetical protein